MSWYKNRRCKEDIIENGINTEEGRVIYVDVDGMKCMNGFNRFYLCNDKKIDIRGWMIQLMRYDDEISRILHANKSNVQKVIAHNNPKKEDVAENLALLKGRKRWAGGRNESPQTQPRRLLAPKCRRLYTNVATF